MKNRWVLWKRSLAISSASILQIAGAVLKDQDREAADGATTPLATTVTVGLAGGGSGRTSPPVLASATTTSYMASRKSQQPQGSQFHGVTNCIIQAYSRHLTCTCRQPCIGLCYLNKLRLSKGLSGIKWRRGWRKTQYSWFINCIYWDLIYHGRNTYPTPSAFFLTSGLVGWIIIGNKYQNNGVSSLAPHQVFLSNPKPPTHRVLYPISPWLPFLHFSKQPWRFRIKCYRKDLTICNIPVSRIISKRIHKLGLSE